MEKPTLAEQVLQKMKEKKQLEQMSRPHYDVLKLEAIFSFELQQLIKQEVAKVQEQVRQEEQTLATLEQHLQELDSTGKQDFLRIIIKPEFIASQRVDSHKKEFFIKSSNTFLRTQILRNRQYAQSTLIEKELTALASSLKDLEDQLWTNKLKWKRVENQKRTVVLQQQLRLNNIRKEILQLQTTIEKEREEKRDLLQEYQLKKVNADNRRLFLQSLEKKIVDCKQQIEQAFNPTTYRSHLKKIFSLSTKNEMLAKSIEDVRSRIKTVSIQTAKYEKSLQKNHCFSKLGKCSSPYINRKRKSIKGESEYIRKEWKPRIDQYPGDFSKSCSLELGSENNKNKVEENNIFDCSSRISIGSTQHSNFPYYRSKFTKKI